MMRMKTFFAALLLIAATGFVPEAHAQTLQVVLAGTSALWQSMALAAYNGGSCVPGGTAPCFHYTNASFNLTDTRPSVKGGTNAVDTGNVWIVWDSAATTNVWAFIKVDSAVGNRCYFAQPRCNVNVVSFPSAGNLINSALWGNNSTDTTPPPAVQTLFTIGVLVNTAATDIRPEDALFATCRANSVLGGGTDGLAGLGYGANNSGVCALFGNPLTDLQGSDVASAYPGSTARAHTLAYAIAGRDPFTDTVVPTFTTVSVGAAPIIFITSRSGALASVTNATDQQLQQLFAGANCDASVLGAPSGPIQVYLREPQSGTMNTAEYSVFRYWNVSGASQETGVGTQNPLSKPCSASGSRYRAIGPGEEVKSILNSNANHGTDGIGYMFFSYGEVSAIANKTGDGYLTLNGIDPIFHRYAATGIDPGQPATAGALPSAANLPASCHAAFPCPETSIWSGQLSFPNLRNGSYRAWSMLRIVSNGAALNAAKNLVSGAQNSVVTEVPDFVPAAKVGSTDPGMPLLRSHYTLEGSAPVNIGPGEKGGDAGGCILTSTGSALTSDTTTKLAQTAPGNGCVSVP